MTGHRKSSNLSEHHALKLARFQLMATAQLIQLGLAIRERREELNLSQTRFAQKIPVDPKTVARWESGSTAGAHTSLDVIAERLETTPDHLLARAVAIGREEAAKRGDAAEVPSTSNSRIDRLDERVDSMEKKLDQILTLLGATSPGESDGEDRPDPIELAGELRATDDPRGKSGTG